MEITDIRVRNIEYVLPKLKYSRYIGNVVKWLDNFDEADIDKALDFLFYFEYITFSELQYRLIEQLKKAIKKIPKGEKIVLVPFGEYGKSSDLMVYLVKKTDYFKRKKNQISIKRDINKIDLANKTSIIFLDDFIGSGNSFIKEFNKNFKIFINKEANINDAFYLIASIIMTEGKTNIALKVPNVSVFAQERRNAFDKTNSPFIMGKGPIVMKELATKYGSKIKVDYDIANKSPIYRPLGYDNVASLIAFDYGCPNNTLSIIWGSDNWNPIFPRFAKNRMKQAVELKKTMAFYIGIMNKMGLDLYNNTSIKVHGKRKIKYNTREDHSLLTVLKLKSKKYDNLLICQILGITLDELRVIEIYGETKMIFKDGEITSTGFCFIIELSKLAARFKNKATRQSIFKRNDLLYIPESFN